MNAVHAESHLACRSSPAHADLLSFAAAAAVARLWRKMGKVEEEEEGGLTCESELTRSGGTCFDLLPLGP